MHKLRKTPILLLIILQALLTVPILPQEVSTKFQEYLVPEEYIPALQAIALLPDPERLINAALLFSGASPEQHRVSIDRLAILLNRAKDLETKFPDHYERGNAVFDLLYPDILKRYQETSTTLHEALIVGNYNCVSSAVLFYLTAKTAGLTVTIYLTDNHMFCRVSLPEGQTITAETTSPYGWDPGSLRPVRSSNPKLLSYAYTPKADYAAAVAISPEMMSATIASNRIVLLENRRDYLSALKLSAAIYYFVPEELYRMLLLDRVNNVTGVLVNQKNYNDALLLLESSMKLYGSTPTIDKLYYQIKLVYTLETLGTRPFNETISMLTGMYQNKEINTKDYEQALVYIYSVWVNEIQKKSGWFQAWQEMKKAVEQYPGITALGNLYKTVYANWVSDVHNTFAKYFNSKNYEAAKAVLLAALEWAPSEQKLLNDLALLKEYYQ